MKRHFAVLAFLGTSAALAACAPSAHVSSSPVGECFRLEWSRADTGMTWIMPDSLRFFSDSVGVERDGSVLHRLEPASGRDTTHYAPGEQMPWHRMLYSRSWQATDGDSLLLRIRDHGDMIWFIGLRPTASGYVGRAFWSSDDGHGRQFDVRMVRAGCPKARAAT